MSKFQLDNGMMLLPLGIVDYCYIVYILVDVHDIETGLSTQF
jgi:hypothetical protein